MKSLQKVVIDTSSLINDESVISELIDTYNIILPITIVEELDNLKDKSLSEETKFLARRALHQIDKYWDRITFDLVTTILDVFTDQTNDNRIVSIAKRHKAMVMSDDLNLKLKARILGLEILTISKKVEEYTGYKEVVLSDKEYLMFCEQTNVNCYNSLVNEYLIIKKEDGSITDKLKWNGIKYIPVMYKNINNNFVGKIKPRNINQELAFDMMQDSNITIKILSGMWGSGKDLIMSAHAIDFITKNKYDKIIWLRNNVEVKDSNRIGFLPGSQQDKLLPFASPLADNIGGMEGLQYLFASGKLEIEHLGFIRGRSFKNCLVICSESENTTKEHLQLIISRMAENSQLWINGDFAQIDDRIFVKNNGLRSVIEKLKGQDLVAHVQLNTTERSETAKLASILE